MTVYVTLKKIFVSVPAQVYRIGLHDVLCSTAVSRVSRTGEGVRGLVEECVRTNRSPSGVLPLRR